MKNTHFVSLLTSYCCLRCDTCWNNVALLCMSSMNNTQLMSPVISYYYEQCDKYWNNAALHCVDEYDKLVGNSYHRCVILSSKAV